MKRFADIDTKRLTVSTMKYLMYKSGVFETSSLVEFQSKTNVRPGVESMASSQSLLHVKQVKKKL